MSCIWRGLWSLIIWNAGTGRRDFWSLKLIVAQVLSIEFKVLSLLLLLFIWKPEKISFKTCYPTEMGFFFRKIIWHWPFGPYMEGLLYVLMKLLFFLLTSNLWYRNFISFGYELMVLILNIWTSTTKQIRFHIRIYDSSIWTYGTVDHCVKNLLTRSDSWKISNKNL